MLNLFIEILEECRITLKWAVRLAHDASVYVIDKVMSAIIGR